MAASALLQTPSPGEAHLPDEAAIRRLVHAFYARARTDWLLGPIFETTVDDWPAHLDTLVRFWSSVLLRAGSYRGNPMAAHRPLRLDDQHFARWLALWDATARSVLTPLQARHVFETAQRIGRSLRIGLEIDPLRRERRDAGGPGCPHHHAPDDRMDQPA
ncbi:group III truncated hemoglobin [Luteimonas composti]|uniref:Group III truncated hemoglobin n=1 Tax=Luteimonas composti TaxID=398257 RepID=A0ABT6MSE7_9GAMM|nr:group III truncated hemoglobin [Luteimonas composti]MDH7453539.1 group III truncated hemoglobin [Luteimonas composti]